MSLRPIGEIIGELLPKIAERYRAQARDQSNDPARPHSDRPVGDYIATATASSEVPPA